MTVLIHVAKTESLSTCRIFSKLPFCRQFCRQKACRRQHYRGSRCSLVQSEPYFVAFYPTNLFIYIFIINYNLFFIKHNLSGRPGDFGKFTSKRESWSLCKNRVLGTLLISKVETCDTRTPHIKKSIKTFIATSVE